MIVCVPDRDLRQAPDPAIPRCQASGTKARDQATEPAVVRYSLVRHTQPVSSFRCVSVFG